MTFLLNLAIATLILLWPEYGRACTCMEKSAAETFAAAETVVYARIREVKIPSQWHELGPAALEIRQFAGQLDDFVIARFDIIDVLK